MRVRGLAAAAALLALALVMTGCTKTAPEITDAQVQEWQDLAAKTIPAATEITINANTNATMAGTFASVDIELRFATFADLKASSRAIVELEKTIESDVPGASPLTRVINDGSDAFQAEVSARLIEGVPGLARVVVTNGVAKPTETADADMRVSVYLYAADPAAIDPQWLDKVTNIAESVTSDAGGHFSTVSIFSADAANLDPGDPDLEKSRIQVVDLAEFKEFGVYNGCVRTDSWAYDVSESYVAPYPVGEPGGACA